MDDSPVGLLAEIRAAKLGANRAANPLKPTSGTPPKSEPPNGIEGDESLESILRRAMTNIRVDIAGQRNSREDEWE